MVVTSSARWSFLSSTRVSRRSLASRFDEGLVEEEQPGLAHDRARQRHALLLAARELTGPAVEQMVDLDARGRRAHGALDLRPRRADHAQREADVLGDRHVRVERVALEHHGDVAIAGLEARDVAAVDRDRAAVGLLEAGDDPQRRRLARARGAQQREELARLDVEVQALERDDRTMGLDDVAQADAADRAQPAAALDRADRQPLHDVALAGDADQDDRDHGDGGGRRELGPLGLLDADEVEHVHGHGLYGLAAQQDGEEELVPGVEEDEDHGHGDAAARLRQDDVPQGLEAVGAVEEGRLLHLARDVLEVGHHEPDRERQREREVDDHEAAVGVDPADAVEQQEVGDHEPDRRQHLRREGVEAERLLALEPEPREAVGGRHRQHDRERGRAHADDDAVPHVRQDRDRAEEHVDVVPPLRLEDDDRRVGQHVDVGLERGEQGPEHRKGPDEHDEHRGGQQRDGLERRGGHRAVRIRKRMAETMSVMISSITARAEP